MLKLAKHAVAVAVVAAAAGAPVAAHAEAPSMSFTHVVVTSATQNSLGPTAEPPRVK